MDGGDWTRKMAAQSASPAALRTTQRQRPACRPGSAAKIRSSRGQPVSVSFCEKYNFQMDFYFLWNFY
jgi:hypothetical protein